MNTKKIEVYKIEYIHIIVKAKDIELFKSGDYVVVNGEDYIVEDIASTDLEEERLIKLSTLPTIVYCNVVVKNND